jgi:hypothetical protein
VVKYNKMSTITDDEYKEPTRPYSSAELQYNRELYFKKLRLSDIMTEHEKCNHSYHVRKNGRKEKEIVETNDCVTPNCSVCWKINRTKSDKKYAKELVRDYEISKSDYLSYRKVFLFLVV